MDKQTDKQTYENPTQTRDQTKNTFWHFLYSIEPLLKDNETMSLLQ